MPRPETSNEAILAYMDELEAQIAQLKGESLDVGHRHSSDSHSGDPTYMHDNSHTNQTSQSAVQLPLVPVGSSGSCCGKWKCDLLREREHQLLQATEQIAQLQAAQIWGFYESEYPIYTYTKEAMELCELADPEELNGLVTKLKEKDAAILEYEHCDKSLVEELDKLREQIAQLEQVIFEKDVCLSQRLDTIAQLQTQRQQGFDAWWKPQVEAAEVAPSPEEEGFARAAWIAAKAQPQNNWIDANKAIPRHSVNVLISREGSDVFEGWREGEQWVTQADRYYFYPIEGTHWMPLPKPKEEA